MTTWPTKLKPCSSCVDSCKVLSRAPESGAVAEWKLDLVIIEINYNYIFSSLAFCFLLITGINLPLEQEYVASLQYF